MRYSAVCVVLAVALAQLGCASVQQWAEPHLCDCTGEQLAQAQEDCDRAPIIEATAVVDHQLDLAHYHAETNLNLAVAELKRAEEAEEQDEYAAYRDPEEMASEPINPAVPDGIVELADADARKQFQERHNVELGDDDQVFRGSFTAPGSTSIAVHRPGEAIELYDRGTAVITVELDQFDAATAPDDITDIPPGALELIQDGTHQLKLIHAEVDDDRVTYHLNVYKVIGSELATIFTRPVAVTDDQGEPQRLANVRYLYGVDHRRIEWTPLDDEGQPETDAEVYHWNHWEGLFRVPDQMPPVPGLEEVPRS